jgi:hypothetical protein
MLEVQQAGERHEEEQRRKQRQKEVIGKAGSPPEVPAFDELRQGPRDDVRPPR